MESIYKTLKPLANIYLIVLIWFLTFMNFYSCLKPIKDYATTTGLKTTPKILDELYYYTPDEGYQILTALDVGGRNAYRFANSLDFILPILLFLSLSLPDIALGERCHCLIMPFVYMISDYIENIAERYVLEIYPKRNDLMMTLAIYAGIVKFTSLGISVLILIFNLFKRKTLSTPDKQK